MTRSLLLFALMWPPLACGGEDPAGDPPADSETPTDDAQEIDSASETSQDTASDPPPVHTVCLDSISGRVVIRGADPLPVSVIVCIGTCFAPVSTETDGSFTWRHPIGGDFDCIPYDFEATPLHMDFRVTKAKEAFAEYAFLTVPKQSDISDTGEGDYDLNLGDIPLYALPAETATFIPGEGAEVSLFGLSFTLGPEDLVKFDGDEEMPPEHVQLIRVFKAPLDEWNPPFVEASLSALYFIGPRWARLAGDGVQLTIEAPEDLADGDEVTMYLLGSFGTDWGDEAISDRPDFMYLDNEGHCTHDTGAPGLEWAADGVFQACGRAVVENGRITTPNVPRLTWVGIGP